MLVRRLAVLATAVLGAAGLTAAPAPAEPAARQLTGTVSGAPFVVELPATWNGTFLLWSKGYSDPTQPPPPPVTADPLLVSALLEQGYAIGGTGFVNLPWASDAAVEDQLALLDWFTANVGRPRHTIAIGASLGGQLTTVLAERHPRRFAGALPMCGPVAGAVGWFNGMLDVSFALKTLLWPDEPLQVARIADPAGNHALANGLLDAAVRTPQGQARLALANALGDVPGWVDSLAPEPTDPARRAVHQYLYDRYQIGTFLFGAGRAQAEAELGGNPSWNLGVDYAQQLARSSQRDQVLELYRAAGLSLEVDLAALATAPRIAPDVRAVARLTIEGSTLGLPSVPTLTLHSTGDGTTVVEAERWYADRAAALGRGHNLRQAFVARGNHCFFTVAEQLAAIGALTHRVGTGRWGEVSPAALNAVAESYGPELRQMWSFYSPGTATVDGAFVTFRPQRFLRPFPV
jgi:pimeloyl-ACP methyl ester carboxylesterase